MKDMRANQRVTVQRVLIQFNDQKLINGLRQYVKEFRHSWDDSPKSAKALFDCLPELKYVKIIPYLFDVL